MTKKTKHIIVAILSVAALFGAALIVEEHRAQRMIDYANEHNCKWYNVESFREAVCR